MDYAGINVKIFSTIDTTLLATLEMLGGNVYGRGRTDSERKLKEISKKKR